jgi:hypothetical protein
MKFITLCLLCVMSLTVTAKGHGGKSGPNFPFPFPIPSAEPCDSNYSGQYQLAGGPLDISIQRGPWAGSVNVTLNYRGQMYWGSGQCNNRSVSFDVAGYHHAGNFTHNPFGQVSGIEGWQYSNGRPYQQFAVDLQ